MGPKKAVSDKRRASVYKRALTDKKSSKVPPSKHVKLSDRSKSKSTVSGYMAEVKKTVARFPVVGIGASTGGLEALGPFSTHILPDADIEVTA